jgi:hypothetical protein
MKRSLKKERRRSKVQADYTYTNKGKPKGAILVIEP